MSFNKFLDSTTETDTAFVENGSTHILGKTLSAINFNPSEFVVTNAAGDLTTSTDLDIANLDITGSYQILGVDVLTSTDLGTGIVNSSLTSVGTLSSLSVSSDVDVTGTYKIGGADVFTNATTLGLGVVSSALTSVGTLASLEVTGDVAVSTDNLFVDVSENKVGINTVIPSTTLHLVNAVAGTSTLTTNNVIAQGFPPSTLIRSNMNTGLVNAEPDFPFIELYNSAFSTTIPHVSIHAHNYNTTGSVQSGITSRQTTGLQFDVINVGIVAPDVLVLHPSGNVGIGEPLPTAKLFVDGDCIITTDLEVQRDFKVDDDTLFVDSLNDRVGINKVPVVALDVVGDINATGNIVGGGSITHKNNFTRRNEDGALALTTGVFTDLPFDTSLVSGIGYTYVGAGPYVELAESGLYKVIYKVNFAANGTGSRQAHIKHADETGSNVFFGGHQSSAAFATDELFLTGSTFINAVAADHRIFIVAHQTSGGNLNSGAATANASSNVVEIYRIGEFY